MRKAIVILSTLLVLGGAVYFLIPTQPKETFFVSGSIGAIPKNAAFIVKGDHINKSWKEFQTSSTGQTLLKLDQNGKFSYWFDLANSAFEKNPTLSKLFNNQEVFISGHMVGVSTVGVLVVTENSSSSDLEALTAHFKNLFPNSTTAKKDYENTVINTIKSEEKSLSIATLNGVVLVSNSQILLEQSIRHLHVGKPLTTNQNFAKLLKTADNGMDASLFINFPEFGKAIQSFWNPEYFNSVKSLAHYGEWMEVDLNIKNDGLMMNGISMVGDSLYTYLKSFENQEPGALSAASVLPDNIGFMTYQGFNNYKEFQQGYNQHLAQAQKAFQNNKNINKINSKYGIDLQEQFFDWIGKELVYFSTEGDPESPKDQFALAIHTNNIEQAEKSLKSIGEKTKATTTSEYRGFDIQNLQLKNFFPLVFGGDFKKIKQSYYILLEDYVIFANNESMLKHVLNSYLRGKTLIKSLNFKNFYDQLSDKSSYFVYYNFKHGEHLWPTYLSEENVKNFELVGDSIKNLQGFGYQTVAHKNMFFTNLYINFNPIQEEKSIALIETRLDTTYSSKPWIVRNHHTGEKEILLQDNLNQLYLINNIGKILWKKQLKGKIVGDIIQVDRYKNDKLQYMFATTNSIEQIDRNGHDVSGFPVKTKENTQGLSVLDYDKNRNYRILATQSNALTNYSIDGKVVKGWSYKSGKSGIALTPELIQINKKDYILVASSDGQLRALNRKGEDRLQINVKLPDEVKDLKLWTNNALSNSGLIGVDTLGVVHFLKLTDELETITTKAFEKERKVSYTDLNQDGLLDVVYFHEGQIFGFKMSKQLIFQTGEIENKPTFPIEAFQIGDNKSVVLFTDATQNQCFAFSEKGELINNFPIEGSSPGIIDDLDNDGRFELIVGDQKGSLFIYAIF